MIAAGDADRADVARVVGEQARLAGDSFRDGNAVRLGEGPELALGKRVVDTAARDQ